MISLLHRYALFLHESLSIFEFVAIELILFAGVWFLICGLDDLVLDCVWLWQRLVCAGRHIGDHRPISLAPGLLSTQAGEQPRHAVFIPAWDEADVIADMVAHCLQRWPTRDFRLFVGIYSNDPATGFAALRGACGDNRLALVKLPKDGPTSKADCLNHLWQAMLEDERAQDFKFCCVVMHDAEDLVHPAELAVYEHFLASYDFVQLPVIPLIDQCSPLISGHYADEFAEAHCRTMPVRSDLGVGIPSAGVGCAFRRDILYVLAEQSPDSVPFAADSLTEDYELGLRICSAGGRGIFVRIRDDAGQLVATSAYFPGDLYSSVRQKTRWMIGIALAGWDRTGWGSGLADIWMRARDRRSVLAALVLVAGYLGLLLWTFLGLAIAAGLHQAMPLDPALRGLMIANGLVLVWRLAVRMCCTGRQYGFGQALWSVPRVLVGNIIAVMAARRALLAYAASLRGGRLAWDKTRHQIPALPAAPSPAGRTAVRPQ